MITDAKSHLAEAQRIITANTADIPPFGNLPFNAIFDVKAMQHYFAYFLQNSAERLEQSVTRLEPAEGYFNNLFGGHVGVQGFHETDEDNTIRKRVRLALTEAEHDMGRQMVEQDTALLHAFGMWRVMLEMYSFQILELNSDLYKMPWDRKIDSFSGIIKTLSPAEELLPVFAIGCGHKPETESDFSKGLVAAFRQNTFRSGKWVEVDTPHGPRKEAERQCPFQYVIGHLCNTDLIEKDGGLAIAEDPRAGALPGFLYRQMQQIFPPKTTHRAALTPMGAVG